MTCPSFCSLSPIPKIDFQKNKSDLGKKFPLFSRSRDAQDMKRTAQRSRTSSRAARSVHPASQSLQNNRARCRLTRASLVTFAELFSGSPSAPLGISDRGSTLNTIDHGPLALTFTGLRSQSPFNHQWQPCVRRDGCPFRANRRHQLGTKEAAN